jgi:multidrug efflux pump subunit AcrB
MLTPFRIIILAITISLLGFLILNRLVVDAFPTSNSDEEIVIKFNWAQHSAEEIDATLTSPSEQILKSFPNVFDIKSSTFDGGCRISLRVKGKDITTIEHEISRTLVGLKTSIQSNVYGPYLSRRLLSSKDVFGMEQEQASIKIHLISKNNKPIVKSDVDEFLIHNISTLQDIDRYEVLGTYDHNIDIALNRKKIYDYNLGYEEVLKKLYSYANSSRTLIRGVDNSTHLSILNFSSDVEVNQSEFDKIPIKKNGLNNILLSDIADVKSKLYPDSYTKIRFNGIEAIEIKLIQKAKANLFNLYNALDKNLSRLKETSYSVHIDNSRLSAIKDSINSILKQSLLTILFVCVFLVISTKNLLDILLILLSLMISFGFSVFCFYLLEIKINVYSILGISMSIGMMADYLFIASGLKYGAPDNNKIKRIIFGATTSTLIALLSVYILPEDVYTQFEDLFFVIGINLISVSIVSYIVTPAISSYFSEKQKENRDKKIVVILTEIIHKCDKVLMTYSILPIILLFLVIGIPKPALNKTIEVLGVTLDLKKINDKIPEFLGGLSSAFLTKTYYKQPKEEDQVHKLSITAIGPENANEKTIDLFSKKTEGMLKNFEDKFDYLITTQSLTSSKIDIFFINSESMREDMIFIQTFLELQFRNLGNLKLFISGGPNPPYSNTGGQPPSYRIKLRGPNYSEFKNEVQDLGNKLKQNKRIANLVIDANYSWWTITQTNLSAQPSFQSIVALNELKGLYEYIDLKDDTPSLLVLNPYRIILTKEKSTYPRQDSLYNKLMKFQEINVPTTIEKEDNNYIKWINFDYSGAQIKGEQYVRSELENWKLRSPTGYDYEILDRFHFANEYKPYTLVGILAALLLIFILLVVMYERIKLAITGTCLISFCMILPIYYLTHNRLPLSIGYVVGFIFLIGLVANLIILLMSSFLQYEDRSFKDTWTSVLNDKWDAIWLSILSTLLGISPLLLFSNSSVDFWYSFAIILSLGFINFLLFLPFLSLFFIKKALS